MNKQPPLAILPRARLGEAETACRPSDVSEPLRAGISSSQKWDGTRTFGYSRTETRRDLPLCPSGYYSPWEQPEPPVPPLPLRLPAATVRPAGSSGCFLATLLRP